MQALVQFIQCLAYDPSITERRVIEMRYAHACNAHHFLAQSQQLSGYLLCALE